jgi:hypothetical protein
MNGLGGIVVYVVVIVLTETLSGEAAQSSYVKSPSATAVLTHLPEACLYQPSSDS